ncbi:MAG: ABC transporter permease [Thermodesulfobacteriota bacterium]
MKLGPRYFKNNISLIIGILMFIGIVGASVFAPYFALYDPLEVKISQRLQPMSADHPLGTDFWGRDIQSRILFGGRSSLTIGLASIGVSMILGVILGVVAGYYSENKFANLIVWITDITMSFPTLILGAMVGMMFGPGIFNTIIAIAVAFWPRFVRLARASALSVKEEVFIVAAKSLGMSDLRIFGIHLIPNIISPVIVMAVIWASDAITIEVALSFLGLGVPPPTASWGTVLQDNLRYFRMAPMAVIWPCVAIAWAVQSLNLIGDRFRDILDPKMR